MHKAVLATGALLLLMAPVAPAFAHDDYDSHARDHAEHGDYHEDQAEEHQRAHEEGFESRWEHRAYHRALRSEHEEFPDDHPTTWHDHYRRYW